MPDLVQNNTEAVIIGKSCRVVDYEVRGAPREEPRHGASGTKPFMVHVHSQSVQKLPCEVRPTPLHASDQYLSP